MAETEVARVIHYYDRIGVAVLELSQDLRLGDWVSFRGSTTDFKQQVRSLQVDHQEVKEGRKGQQVALKTQEKARKGDRLFRAEG